MNEKNGLVCVLIRVFVFVLFIKLLVLVKCSEGGTLGWVMKM